MTKKVIQPGQGRSNTGRSVMYEYSIGVTVGPHSDDMRNLYMDLPSNIKMPAILSRVKLALEMKGEVMDHRYLSIEQCDKLPDTRTDEWRKEQA